jgi:pyruvate/2-oxoacid:ferredoxin oxidoreductase beta subunit
MGSKSRQRGKSAELAVAKYWGCKRAHFEAHDLTGHRLLTIEVKCRSTNIKQIAKWMEQAEAAVEPGKTAIVQFHTLGEKYSEDIVFIRAKDFRELVGYAECAKGGTSNV